MSLRGARLTQCLLQGADLSGADMCGAKFDACDLTGVQLGLLGGMSRCRPNCFPVRAQQEHYAGQRADAAAR